MKKKFVIIASVIVICLASVAVGAVAERAIREIKAELRPDFTIIIDGEKQDFKNVKGETVEPILYNGTTYLPVRAIGELMGKKVYWYEDDKIIEFKDYETTVTDADVIVPSKDVPPEKLPDKPKNDAKAESVKNDEVPKANPEFIGEKKAKEIVLKKAGLKADEVRFDKVELDKDNGVWYYEIEFNYGYKEYSADVNALDGSVRDYEIDIDD